VNVFGAMDNATKREWAVAQLMGLFAGVGESILDTAGVRPHVDVCGYGCIYTPMGRRVNA
jgi:hypothetical protein